MADININSWVQNNVQDSKSYDNDKNKTNIDSQPPFASSPNIGTPSQTDSLNFNDCQKDESQSSVLSTISLMNSTPEKNQIALVNISPQSDLSLSNSDSVQPGEGSDTHSSQDSGCDKNDYIQEREEPQSEPDVILYSPRTSSDTEQDNGYSHNFINNYIFDLFGAED